MRLRGVFSHILWRDERDGLTFFSVMAENETKERKKGNRVVVIAKIPRYIRGIPLAMEGEWEDSPKGPRFRANRVWESSWAEHTAISFLASGLFKDIGENRAYQIVQCMGFDVFAAAELPGMTERLAKEVAGLSKDAAVLLCEQIRSTVAERELFEFLIPYGCTCAAIAKLFKAYGTRAKNIIREAPFFGMKYGMTFEQCDRLGADHGVHAAAPERVCAAAMTVMDRFGSKGDVYAYQNRMLEATGKLMTKTAYPSAVPVSVISAITAKDKRLLYDFGLYNKVYLKRMYQAECNIANQIKRLMETGVKLNYEEGLVDYAEELCGMKYAKQQREAFTLLQRTGVAILTGGPGTGKTTTVNGIISAYEKMYPKATIKLCAPTGRAAQRMTESTGRESVTIHRLLEYRPFEAEVLFKTAENPIEADFIVVDEASMLDVEIASIFLSAVRPGTLVLFIGDVNQLPSVGAGDVLNDLIQSQRIPCVQLTEVYRQKGSSPIVTNANKINQGETDLVLNAEFICKNLEKATDVADVAIKYALWYYDADHPFDTTVLCPTHKGNAGVAAINKRLQEIINPKREGVPEYHYGQRIFRKFDKVILLQNNYQAGYFNGDLGIVTDILENGIEVNIMGKVLSLTREMMEDVNLAYAMTIHKSQGSEFKNVVIALPFEPKTMLKRNLIYTAVTRAKKNVAIIAEYGALDKAVSTSETGKRKTDLQKRIRETLRTKESPTESKTMNEHLRRETA